MPHVARQRVTGVLLAGGKSVRMGKDKALLEFCGAPMVAWCGATLAQCAPRLVVSSSTDAHARACVRALKDAWPRFTVLRGVEVTAAVDAPDAAGPLAGLRAALARVETDRFVLSACDTPLAPAELYRREVELLGEHEAVAPLLEAPEPMLTAWRTAPAREAAAALPPEGAGPRALLERLHARFVARAELEAWGVDPDLLASANTPQALARLAAHGPP